MSILALVFTALLTISMPAIAIRDVRRGWTEFSGAGYNPRVFGKGGSKIVRAEEPGRFWFAILSRLGFGALFLGAFAIELKKLY